MACSFSRFSISELGELRGLELLKTKTLTLLAACWPKRLAVFRFLGATGGMLGVCTWLPKRPEAAVAKSVRLSGFPSLKLLDQISVLTTRASQR